MNEAGLEARAGFLEDRAGPRGLWGWCLPTDEWSGVLDPLVDRAVSK